MIDDNMPSVGDLSRGNLQTFSVTISGVLGSSSPNGNPNIYIVLGIEYNNGTT